MNRKILLFLTLLGFFISGCTGLEDTYPIDKRYWDPDDYATVVRELRFGIEPDEILPNFNDTETSIVVVKLTDHQNYKIVLDDNELGIKYRSEIASEYFKRWKDMNLIYRATDRRDKYLYDREMIEVWHFGLGLQLRYFKLGNDFILETADDPQSPKVRNNLNSNINVMINNFNIYLDEINNEQALSEGGRERLAMGIDEYFHELVNTYPKANYGKMQQKIALMEKKSESPAIKKSLKSIEQLIRSKAEQG